MAIINQKEIIKSIKEGNESKALAGLYGNTLLKVRSYIRKNNGSKDEANDIFQDALIVFFRYVKADKFDESKDIDAFIFTIAKNLWIDKAKRDKKIIYFDNADKYDSPANKENQLTAIIAREKAEAMQMVFNKLDDKCKSILRYFLYDKKSMKEISILMGFSSEDVAKTNHYRCKQYLSKIVKSDLSLLNLLKN